MSSFEALPGEIKLEVANYLIGADFLCLRRASPAFSELADTYENSLTKRIATNSLLTTPQTDSSCTKVYTILNDIMDPLHPDESTVILQHLLKEAPEFKDSRHNLLEGAVGLGQYSKFYRGLKSQYLFNNRTSKGGRGSNRFSVSYILMDLKARLIQYDENMLQAMRAVYNILAKRIEDADNKFNRPLVSGRMQHGRVGLACQYQQNLIDTMISAMDFLPGDFERIERCGPAEVFYESTMKDINIGFFSDPFREVAKDGECRRVEELGEREEESIRLKLQTGLLDTSIRLHTSVSSPSFRLSRGCRTRTVRYGYIGGFRLLET